MTRAREAGSGRRARGEARKQGEGIGHDRTSRVWAGGGQEPKRAGRGGGGGGGRGEERCVSSRRSSLVAVLDRSLRPCGGPPAAPVFVVGTGDVPAVTRRQETYLQPVAPNRAARFPRDRVDNEQI